jgi:hypothetical protein
VRALRRLQVRARSFWWQLQLQKAVEKQNELQERANALMEGLTDALRGLAQEIADMPDVQAAREREKQVAKTAATGAYATPPGPGGRSG